MLRPAAAGLLIPDALAFGGLWYTTIPDAIDYAEHRSRSHDAVITVYDAAGNLLEVHRHKGDFKEWSTLAVQNRRRALRISCTFTHC